MGAHRTISADELERRWQELTAPNEERHARALELAIETNRWTFSARLPHPETMHLRARVARDPAD